MKKLFYLFLLLGIGVWALSEINGNFSKDNITLNEWPSTDAATPNSPEELQQAKKILDQPFSYLGQGRQSFIFESNDGLWVLKFVKCGRINRSDTYKNIWLPSFLDRLRQDDLTERNARRTRMFNSLSLAKDPLQKQTGVLLLHINPSKELMQPVTLIDRLGLTHTIDIDEHPFVLQKKAQGGFATLKALLKENKKEELRDRLNQLLDLFVQRASLGIVNPDGKLIRHNNVGFLANRAIYIDLGTLKRSQKSSDPAYLEKDFQRLDPILNWLRANDKALAEEFSYHTKQAKERIINHQKNITR